MTLNDFVGGVFTWASGLGYSVAYPGKSFTPPDSGEWLELNIIHNDLDPDLTDQTIFRRGIIQLNVCGRPNKNPLTLYGIADGLVTGYPKASAISGATITKTPYTSSLLEMDDRVMLPVTFEYSE